jgi:molybdenum-dependent DNA-binding transcriptional regulator ModE
MRPGSNCWRDKDGEVVVSAWCMVRLEAVEQTGSMRAAAAQHWVPLRVAWRKIPDMEDGLGVFVTQRSTGL